MQMLNINSHQVNMNKNHKIYHYTPTKMAKIKKINSAKCYQAVEHPERS